MKSSVIKTPPTTARAP